MIRRTLTAFTEIESAVVISEATTHSQGPPLKRDDHPKAGRFSQI